MQRLIDTHAHFDWFESNRMTEEVLERAKEAGLERIIAVGANHESNMLALCLSERYSDFISCAIGYDRDQATKNPSTSALDDLLSEHKQVCAVGEIGLDYHYHGDTASQQRKLFVEMLEIARKHGKTVNIHSRDADADTLDILDEHIQELGGQLMKGVLHCFTRSYSFAEKVLERGLFISFSGILTFNSALELQHVAKMVPQDRILIETDCPYLAPEPCRGKKNEPAFVEHTLRFLAALRNTDAEEMAEITVTNAINAFGLDAIND